MIPSVLSLHADDAVTAEKEVLHVFGAANDTHATSSIGLAPHEDVRGLPPDFACFAADCRAAATAFLEGVERGWGKRELAMWLAGPYRALAKRPARAPAAKGGAERSVDGLALADVMARAYDGVVAFLLDLEAGEWQPVTDAMRAHHVRPSRLSGDLVWLPVDAPRMRLEERVRSLFLVDYLFEPESYEGAFGVCASCSRFFFDVGCPRCGDGVRPSYVRELADAHAEQLVLPRIAR